MKKHNESSWEDGGVSPSPFNSPLTAVGRPWLSLLSAAFPMIRYGWEQGR